MTRPPSVRQRAALDLVAKLIAKNERPPTMREIAVGLGITSNAVNDLLKGLIRKGFLARDPMISRGLRLTELGRGETKRSGGK